MSLATRVRDSWASVRPRTRRGRVVAAAGILSGAAVLSIALFAGAAMAWSPYLDFSLHRDVDARAWAAMQPTYASSALCATCHAPQAGRIASASHEGIGCQSCHGALLDHATISASPGASADAAQGPASSTGAATTAIAVPEDVVCVRCHVQVQGRPSTQRQIVPGGHYVSMCLQCHDPHTAVARRPPVVLHPLDNLPPCLTCHGPEGFKARDQRHPAGSVDDQPCLACHAAGRGPDERLVTP